jgi:hypothetical protein
MRFQRSVISRVTASLDRLSGRFRYVLNAYAAGAGHDVGNLPALNPADVALIAMGVSVAQRMKSQLAEIIDFLDADLADDVFKRDFSAPLYRRNRPDMVLVQ